jgi:glycerate dehydrogenase
VAEDKGQRRAVFLDLDSVDRGDLDLAPLKGCVDQWQSHGLTLPGETAERIADAEIAITNKVVLDRGLLEQAGKLKLVCISATGTNNVDLAAARELGIAVTNVAGYSTPSVVQHVFAVLLTLVTRLDDYRQAVRRGDWQAAELFCMLDYPITELPGMRLGIVGYGALGQGVARVAEAFGMEVLLANRPGSPLGEGRIPLEDLLPQVDVLSLHCPLSDETRNLIGPQQLAAMKPGAILINTARGGIVDEVALAEALRNGQLAGAGVDVLAKEPPREGNPLLDPDIPNLILTPHSAWAGRASRQRVIEEMAENIAAFYRGEARNRVEG